jgi:ribosomal-protein-alanine N-acetyltransferase
MGRGSTGRVHLRPPWPVDEEEFLARVRASQRLHRPWTYPPDTRAGFQLLLARNDLETEVIFLVCRSEDEALTGMVNLSQIFLGDFRSAYLGYFAFVPFEGQGYLSEGVTLMLRHAFGPLSLHRVEANVQPGNARSIALVERLGFRREGYSPQYLKIGGRWRDHVRYAILANEFRARDGRRRRSP